MKVSIQPLGVAYIAAVVRGEVQVEIMDGVAESDYERDLGDGFSWMGASLPEIRARIEKFQPDLVGIGCIFSSVFPVIREICREIKKINPAILTVVGGTYPTFMTEHCLSEPGLDFIVLGEGETAMLELVRHLRDGRELSEIDGLAFKEQGRVKVNPKTKWITDLDSIPFPARDLLPMSLYSKVGVPHSLSMTSRRHAPMITSRGCSAHCIYCSSARFWGNHYRFRSPGNVLAEIESLVRDWGIEEIQFEDDNMTADRKRAKEIFRGIIERGLKIKFNFPNGLAMWTLDEEMVDLMAKAGCYEMTLAYESGCPEVLKRIVKNPLNLEKAAVITKHIKAQGIRTDSFYIIGFPGETREQIQQTFRFAREMGTDIAYFFVANPLPGSELYAIAKQENMLAPDFNFENLSFSHSAYNESVWPKGELEKMAGREFVKYAIRSFFRHPLVILRRLVIDLFFKRPAYTLGILLRIWRRNVISTDKPGT
jgi:magnesium-protoporphyrin IX monomethyl ester (oxidative) cyclase